jgi:hypothetical protein
MITLSKWQAILIVAMFTIAFLVTARSVYHEITLRQDVNELLVELSENGIRACIPEELK